MPANTTINGSNCSLPGKNLFPGQATKIGAIHRFTDSQFYFEPPPHQTRAGSVNLYLNIYKYVYRYR